MHLQPCRCISLVAALQELDIARYPAAQQAEDPALRSRVVTCGSVSWGRVLC